MSPCSLANGKASLDFGALTGLLQQLGQCDNGGGTAAYAIEEGYHLRHRCHLHGAGPHCAGHTADHDGCHTDDDTGRREGVGQHDHSPGHGQDHAKGCYPVSMAGVARRTQELESDNEEDGSQQVD